MVRDAGWLGIADATRELSEFRIEYNDVWRMVTRNEVRARRRGRLWEIESGSLAALKERLTRERATVAAR